MAKQDAHVPSTVDPEEEPSAAWGWHGGFPRGSVIAGWVSFAILIAINWGNHQGHVEDIWLAAIALFLAAALIRHHLKARRPWRR